MRADGSATGNPEFNGGVTEDLSILELAHLIRDVVHPAARIEFDSTKPDGTPRKLLDVSRLHELGWRHRTALVEGVRATYNWYQVHDASALAP